jgi:hypothetical protein
MAQALRSIGQLMAAVQQASAAGPTAPVALPPTAEDAIPYVLELIVSEGWHADEQVWEAIGQLPQLRFLMLTWDDLDVTMTPRHLSALAPLASTLQALNVRQHRWPEQELNSTIDHSFVGAFTTLTSLGLQLPPSRTGLDSVSGCCGLRKLNLSVEEWTTEDVALKRNEVAAICQLAGLEEMHLYGLTLGERNDACGLLPGLKQLQQLYVPWLHYAAVPALASLRQLKVLTCGWDHQQLGDSWRSARRCTSLQTLRVVSGKPPLWAFPGLEVLFQKYPWELCLRVQHSSAHSLQSCPSVLTISGGSPVLWRP